MHISNTVPVAGAPNMSTYAISYRASGHEIVDASSYAKRLTTGHWGTKLANTSNYYRSWGHRKPGIQGTSTPMYQARVPRSWKHRILTAYRSPRHEFWCKSLESLQIYKRNYVVLKQIKPTTRRS